MKYLIYWIFLFLIILTTEIIQHFFHVSDADIIIVLLSVLLVETWIES